jgi:hypothetical protein
MGRMEKKTFVSQGQGVVFASICQLVVDGPGLFLVVNNRYGLQEYGKLSVMHVPKSCSL